jgi:hypothetical protein
VPRRDRGRSAARAAHARDQFALQDSSSRTPHSSSSVQHADPNEGCSQSSGSHPVACDPALPPIPPLPDEPAPAPPVPLDPVPAVGAMPAAPDPAAVVPAVPVPAAPDPAPGGTPGG